MPRMRLLVVDDDPHFRSYVSRGLRESGHECEVASGGVEARALLGTTSQPPFDLVLLDVMMPDMSGWTFIEEIRRRELQIPVIFVTARDAVAERVKGLNLGASDYIIKPFAFAELLARMEAVLRTSHCQTPLRVADLTIDRTRRTVQRAGRTVELSPREFDLLLVLARHPHAVMARDKLLADVWGIAFDPGTNVVDVHIARLRRKLGEPALIHTAPRHGYAFLQPERSGA